MHLLCYCVIYLLFVHPAVAARVYENHRDTPLKMEDVTLDIKHLRNTHKRKTLRDSVQVQAHLLFLQVSHYSH